MKTHTIYLAVFAFLMISVTACGQQEVNVSSIAVRNGSVIWQGRINERPDLLQVWNDTATCIANVYPGPYRMEYPEVVETNSLIAYGMHLIPAACDISSRIIYIQANPNQSSEAIYLAHEVVHAITGIDNRGHVGTDPSKWAPVFYYCGNAIYYTDN